MPWGGRRIGRFLGKSVPHDTPVGESWEVSDHPVHISQLATATGYGVTLRQLMQERRAELLGPAAHRYATFPWLIKLLDARDWLSVQVHPDEEAVKRLLPGEGAKTEAWLILDVEPTARIHAGMKPGVGKADLLAALQNGAVADCLHAFTPQRGDVVFLPAGVVHAVGGGVLMAEIQQTSDATFRLFDWNRTDAKGQPRKLHIDEALASIHWDQGQIKPIVANVDPRPLVRCPYFELERVRWSGSITVGGSGRLQALIVTTGHGRFANGEFLMAGDVWILPAASRAIDLNVEAPVGGLLCTLPD